MSAPPYRGEGAHALWQFSEDAAIERFEPEDRYWISPGAVEPIERVELSDLLALHADAEIELRIAPHLLDPWERVIASTLDFSGIRLRNATLV